MEDGPKILLSSNIPSSAVVCTLLSYKPQVCILYSFKAVNSNSKIWSCGFEHNATRWYNYHEMNTRIVKHPKLAIQHHIKSQSKSWSNNFRISETLDPERKGKGVARECSEAVRGSFYHTISFWDYFFTNNW